MNSPANSPDKSPLISVIVPTFNRAARLPRAVQAVLAQTWRPLELVVVDDGSTDHTAAVLQGLKTQVDQAGVSARFVAKRNGGAASARNAGIAAATGQWLGFLDDDDTWQPEKLQAQMETLQQTGASLCACLLHQPTSRGGRTIPGDAAKLPRGRCAAAYLTREVDFSIVSVLVRADVARQAGRLEEDMRIAEDLLWCYRLLLHAEACAVPRVLGEIGMDAGSLTRTDGLQRLVELDTDIERWLTRARQAGCQAEGWNESGWRGRVAADFRQFVLHRLYVGDLAGAREVFQRGMDLCGGLEPLAGTSRKLRKARWLSWLGLRLKHPKK